MENLKAYNMKLNTKDITPSSKIVQDIQNYEYLSWHQTFKKSAVESREKTEHLPSSKSLMNSNTHVKSLSNNGENIFLIDKSE